jgi:condensin complex subunit 2
VSRGQTCFVENVEQVLMAPTRRARSPQDPHSTHPDDADTDSEPATPKPHKQHLRKRLSEAYNLENDTSFTSDSGRPQRPVNINDDAAEKRRRRKSTKITVVENAMAGPSSDGNMDTDALETSRTAKQKHQLKSVAPPPVITVSKDVMSSNFEEWMKMATDNVCPTPLLPN